MSPFSLAALIQVSSSHRFEKTLHQNLYCNCKAKSVSMQPVISRCTSSTKGVNYLFSNQSIRDLVDLDEAVWIHFMLLF